MDKNFTPTDLLDQDDFVRWIRTDKPYHPFWTSYESSSREHAENIQIARKWLHALQVEDAEKDRKVAIDRVWSRIQDRVSSENLIKPDEAHRAPNRRSIRQLYIRWSVAAACLIGLGGMWLWQLRTSPTIEITKMAETTKISLPDGSQVVLNADSKLSYREDSWEKDRVVHLKGEAFFEVEEGSRFSVNTPQGLTTVLGTSFNVYDRDSILEVSCYTGRVEVSAVGKVSVLVPGEQVNTSTSLIHKTKFDTDQEDWRSGFFRFQNASLGVVLDELARQYGTNISMDDTLRKRTYSGFFDKRNLEKALHAVCWPMGLDYSINQEQVRIVPKQNID